MNRVHGGAEVLIKCAAVAGSETNWRWFSVGPVRSDACIWIIPRGNG